MRKAPAFLALMLLIAPLSAVANHGGTEPTVVRGHTLDLFGQPVRAYIGTSHNCCDGHRWTISSAADGSYELDVVPGATMLHIWGYEYQDHLDVPVNTLTETESVDVLLTYTAYGQVWGGSCCIASAARPGDTVTIQGYTSNMIGDKVRMRWRDEESGTELELTRFYPFNDRVSWFEGSFTIPPDRPEGGHQSTFRMLDATTGVPVGNPGSVTTIVDATPPVITATVPADGAIEVKPTAFRPRITASDSGGAGISDFLSHVRIYDVSAPGQRDPVKTTYGSTYNDFYACGTSCYLAGDPYNLTPGHRFEAEFVVKDFAANATTKSIFFVTDGGLPAFSGAAPLGTTSDRLITIEAFVTDSAAGPAGIDPSGVQWTVTRTSDPATASVVVIPNYDAATGRMWVTPGGVPNAGATTYPPLLDGDYSVTATAKDRAGNAASFTWSFTVAG